MKLSRKLIPAMIMLLVSAVLMSTASFAWFSVNTTATADGMSVTVASAKNLLISTEEKGTYVSVQSFPNASVTNLVPASAVPNKAPQFYYMKEAGVNMTADSHQYGSDSQFAAGTAGTHYLTFTAWLKGVGETVTGESIVPEIVFGKSDSPVYPAMRVLVVVNDTNFYLYAPYANADASYTPIAGLVVGEDDKPTDKPDLADEAVSSYSTNNATAITTVTKEVPVKVTVYVWLEGQDSHCKAANAVSLSENSLVVKFNLKKVEEKKD